METTLQLSTEFISLTGLLKLAGVADSGGQAKHLILASQVRVNGGVETRRGTKIRAGDVVEVGGEASARIVVT